MAKNSLISIGIFIFFLLITVSIFLSSTDRSQFSSFSLPLSYPSPCPPRSNLPLKVFMYDLPPRFNVEMLSTSRKPNPNPSYGGIPPWPAGSGMKLQHSVEYWVMASLMGSGAEEEGEAVRVSDGAKADVFFVPFFSSLSFNTHGKNMTDPDTEIDRQLQGKETSKDPSKIGDRTTSDVVVRLRTDEGRDHWFYCHSQVLTEKSKYFADRLSENWPTCQILDSRYCVEVHCQEPEFNFHVDALRLLYIPEPHTWHGVRNALGILQVAVNLGCHQMARACTEYLEASPWEEAEEEEILRTIPGLGSQYEQILARLQPVDRNAVIGIFISAIRFATSSPPASMRELKSSAQDQLEYMLTEDDDVPLLSTDDGIIKSEVKACVNNLLSRFHSSVEALQIKSEDDGRLRDLKAHLCDISWVCQILSKMEMMKDLVLYWAEATDKIVTAAELLRSDGEMLETKLKVVEVAWKVLEAICFGNVVFPTARRLHMVRSWLPFVQRMWSLVKPGHPREEEEEEEEVSSVRLEGDVWQGLESAFISIVLTLPSGDQADILAEWLRCRHVRYPDLTEAFEVWCYRSKMAKKRVALVGRLSNV